jgi:hypothetical protein
VLTSYEIPSPTYSSFGVPTIRAILFIHSFGIGIENLSTIQMILFSKAYFLVSPHIKQPKVEILPQNKQKQNYILHQLFQSTTKQDLQLCIVSSSSSSSSSSSLDPPVLVLMEWWYAWRGLHPCSSLDAIPVVNLSRLVSGTHQRMMAHKNAGLECKTPLLVTGLALAVRTISYMLYII